MGNAVYRVHYRTPDGSVRGRLVELVDGKTAVRQCRILRECYGLHAWFRREDPPQRGRLSSLLAKMRLRRLDE